MKREIKFRGLPTCKDNDELDYINFDRDGNFAVGFYEDGYIIGNVAEASEDYISPEFWVAVDINTVGQYTGLHDKNGRKIYEGDIVRSSPRSQREKSFVGAVRYGRVDPSFTIHDKDGHDFRMYLIGEYRTYEVIGNIFDNPELLEADIQ